jgi:hypothetical protein
MRFFDGGLVQFSRCVYHNFLKKVMGMLQKMTNIQRPRRGSGQPFQGLPDAVDSGVWGGFLLTASGAYSKKQPVITGRTTTPPSFFVNGRQDDHDPCE